MKKRKVEEINSTENVEKVEKEYYDKLIQGHVNLLKKLTTQIDEMEHEYLLRIRQLEKENEQLKKNQK